MRKPVSVPVGVAVAFLMVAVTGCGDGDDHGTSESPAHATPSTQPTTTTPTPPPSKSAVVWPAPPEPLRRTVAAGLKPEVKEFLTYHVHAHLDVFLDGEVITVPAGIGINIHDPDVQLFTGPDGSDAYGGIDRCGKPCISPLHTHDITGVIHTESATPEPNTLGQFFTEWGVRLSRSCVQKYCSPKPIAFYVDGTRFPKDPRAIELTDHEEIAVVIGTPPAQIPETADFSLA